MVRYSGLSSSSSSRKNPAAIGFLAAVLVVSLTFAAPFLAANQKSMPAAKNKPVEPAHKLSKEFKGKLPITDLSEQEAVIHALNRLAFGPRPGDVERIRAMGLEKWIQQQLKPESIDDSAVAKRLEPYTTLAKSTSQLMEEYPNPAAEASRMGITPEEYRNRLQEQQREQTRQAFMQNPELAVALPDVRQFQMMAASPVVEGGFEAVYAQTVDQALRGTGTGTFEAIDMLRKANLQRYQPENGAQYPPGRFGQSLLQVAQLIKANIGLEVAFLDSGGWDNHVNEGGVQGQLSNLLRDLGQGLAAFHRDLGDRMADIVLVTMSEFGRTAAENGNRGTDHGHANCMFLLGGDLNGGKVHVKWPGLDRGQLYEGRDLALTTDFRTVLSELLARHMGNAALSTVFPGFSVNAKEFLGVLKA